MFGSGLTARVLPGLLVLRRYERSWLWPDAVAGLTVGAMLIPQSMGYAELADMPPQYGFYAGMAALLVYAMVGTSRHLGVGPEPGTAILAAAAVAPVAAGDPARYISLMAALALLVAAVCILGAVARLGHLASMSSRPVLVGYISGVGLTLLSSQIATFSGVKITADSFFPRVRQFLSHLGNVHGATFSLAAGALLLMLVVRWRTPTFPAALIAVVLATTVVGVFGLGRHGVALVGAIPAGFPRAGLPDVGFRDLTRMLPAAAGIALVGFTDNVLTARAIAAKKGYRIDPNQELFALGTINLASGLSRGFPISSSASRTAVPASLGSRTQLVSVIGAGFIIVTLLALRPALSQIPRAVLAAVIVTAAISIIDVPAFLSLWRFSRAECILSIVATFGVIVFGVLPGIVIAVALSIAVALTRFAHPHDAVLGDLPGLDGWVDIDDFPNAVSADGLLVFRFDAPLFFLNIDRFCDRVEEALRDNPGDEEWFVMDCEGIGDIDASAIEGLRDLVARLTAGHVRVVAVARANDRVRDHLRRASLLEPNGPIRHFPTINGAVRAFRERI